MNRYKKKTIALILASVISIAGSFADYKYKNTLMDLSFSTSSNGNIDMVLETKQPYSGNVTPIKQDSNTYVLLLPEMNSQAPTPNLSSGSLNIKSVNIRTMPYSGNNNGYTKIVIKTDAPLALNGVNKVFVPTQEYTRRISENRQAVQNNTNNVSGAEAQYYKEHYAKKPSVTTTENKSAVKQENSAVRQENSVVRREQPTENTLQENREDSIQNGKNIEVSTVEPTQEKVQNEFNQSNNGSNDSNYEAFFWICAILLAFVLIIYFVVRAQNKMQTLAGESFELNLEDEKQENKHKNVNKIKNEINRLDSTYKNNISKSRFEIYQPENQNSSAPIEKVDVVDLDEMFKEKKENTMSTQEENISINEFESDDFDFLNYLADTNTEELEEEQFNEELYSSILDSNRIKFNQDDIDKINILINSEISEEIIKALTDFIKDNKIVKTYSKLNKRESLISSYQEQNIVFNDADIVILDKLINVEIDKDFAKSLATDKNKTSQMEKDILDPSIKRPPSIDKVLNVKDMLPNLSLELRKQGNRKIESDRKPEVIYSEEGYDVQVLSSDDLPNITIEIKNNKYDEYKASADYEYQAEGFENKTLNVDGMLPDLDDVLKHPQRYEEKKVKQKPSERDLFNSIKNVQFKPFYEDEMIDLSAKFEDRNTGNVSEDLEAIFNEAPIISDFDNDKESVIEDIEEVKEVKEEPPLKIEEDKTEVVQPENHEQESLIVDSKIIKILSTAEIDSKAGCHLVKNDNGYSVIGYVGNKTYDLKTFDELKSEKIQIRQNRSNADTNAIQYLVRIGLNKFIIEYKEEQLKYIMDLC